MTYRLTTKATKKSFASKVIPYVELCSNNIKYDVILIVGLI